MRALHVIILSILIATNENLILLETRSGKDRVKKTYKKLRVSTVNIEFLSCFTTITSLNILLGEFMQYLNIIIYKGIRSLFRSMPKSN